MTRVLRIAAALAALCAGCAAPPQPVAPAAHEQIAEAGTRGAALARAGDHAGAALRFQEALRVARTIEDADAIALHAVNLSIVYQRLGHRAAARSALAVVLEDERRRFPARRIVQARLRQSILDLADGDVAAAKRNAADAFEGCRDIIACELAAAILNVQATAAFQGGEAQESLRLALAAESAARGRSDAAETANALRNVGRSRAALGDPAAAIAALEEALQIDRRLAEPRKILADLEELERASSAKGDVEAARGYAQRALAIRRASGEGPAAEGEVEVRLR
jgi:tetratricopeptide (TPR) repeat protein